MPPAALLATLWVATAEAPVHYGAPAPLDPAPLELAALAALRDRLGPEVQVAPELSRAARALAARASAGPAVRTELRQALAEAGCFDPTPVLLSVSAAARDLPAALAGAVRGGEPTHLGLGVAARGAAVRVVVLLSQRELTLDPFPRDLKPGTSAELRGELQGSLRSPRVFATDPAGAPRPLPVRGERRFSAALTFDRPGRWLLEVLGDGPSGPRVVALLPVSVGGASLAEEPRTHAAEPAEVAEAEAQVLAAVNRLRGRSGLAPLTSSPALGAVARRHSAAMLERRQVAHLLADGKDAGDRLREARLPFRRVLENLARSESALSAHASLEESPAHLASLLAPEVEQVGIGVARQLSGIEPVVYLTELLVQPVDDSSDSRLRPEARVRETLWRERKRRGQPDLISDPKLDELAGRAARAMLRADDPGLGGFDREALGLNRTMAAVDAFVAASPDLAARSKNVGDGHLRRVGIGVAIGDSPRYGAGLLWIAAIYTD